MGRGIGYALLGASAGMAMMGNKTDWVNSLGFIVLVFSIVSFVMLLWNWANTINLDEGY